MSFEPRHFRLFALPAFLCLLFLPGPRGSASCQVPCENESGYRPHRLWRGEGAYASPVNLLNEGTSFETGEPGISALDGAVYHQRQFVENLVAEEEIADAYLDFSVDSATAVHGTRSFRIDFDGPYPPGGPSAWYEASWEWFGIPGAGRYDISMYAKSNNAVNVIVSLIGLDTLGSEIVWVDLDTTVGVLHKTLPVAPGGWQRLSVRTPHLLSPSLRYVIRIWSNGSSEPSWCIPEGTTLWLDAVQVAAAPEGDDPPLPYDFHTAAEELFLSFRGGMDLLPRRNSLFFSPGEFGPILGRAVVYQDTALSARGGGTLHWKLYSLDPEIGEPVDPIAEGSTAIAFPHPRRTVEVPLSPHMNGRLGVYKWIVEFEDGWGIRADRQEATFALVRNTGAPTGAGNFGVNLNAVGANGKNASGSYSPSAQGRLSLRQAIETVSGLGFTRDRIFGAFDWGTTMEDPGNPMRYDFYPPLAESYGLRVFPVVSSVPGWWSGSDWNAWRSFMEEQVGRYGPAGMFGEGMTEWNIFNEESMAGGYSPAEYAPFLLGAADTIHGTTPPGEMLISINGTGMPGYLIELLGEGDGGERIADLLDGVGVNRYAPFDDAAEEIEPPEDPSAWHGEVPNGVWVQRAARLAAQLTDTAGTGGPTSFPLTETGVNPGCLLADRRSRMHMWNDGAVETFANSMSGSLEKGKRAAERFIRHEILCLAEGGGPIYLFGAIPLHGTWSSAVYGLFHTDHSPAAPLAAQAELNAELGRATFTRRVPATDLRGPGGAPNLDFSARVYIFEDAAAGEYVIAAWTRGWETEIEFQIDPGLYGVTARDFQGNEEPVSGSGLFTRTLTPSPCYIRVDGSITAAGLTEAVDHSDPWRPTWISSWEANGEQFVRFACVNPGDVDSLRLYTRPAADTAWSLVRGFRVWAHPDSAYTAALSSPPGEPLYARASAIEMTTGDEVFSETLFIGPTTIGEEPSSPPAWRDSLFAGGPNPSKESVMLRGTLSRAGTVEIDLFDVAGRRVRSTARVSAAGPFEWVWDGRAENGRRLASGVYLIRVARDGRSIATRRVVLVR